MTIYSDIRALAGDFADPTALTDEDLDSLVNLAAYEDATQATGYAVNILMVAAGYAQGVAHRNVDNQPERARAFQSQADRLDLLSRDVLYSQRFIRPTEAPFVGGGGGLSAGIRTAIAEHNGAAHSHQTILDIIARLQAGEAADLAGYVTLETFAAAVAETARLDRVVMAEQDELDNHQRIVEGLSTSLREQGRQIAGLGDWQASTAGTAAEYSNVLDLQQGSARPLILVITAPIRGNRAGVAFDWPAGQVMSFGPESVAAEAWFVLPMPGRGGDEVDLSAYRRAAAQDIIDGRATDGIILARREAATADGKAVAAQERADGAHNRIDALPQVDGLTHQQSTDIAQNTLSRWPGSAEIVPHEIHHLPEAVTFRGFFRGNVAAYPPGSRMRLVVDEVAGAVGPLSSAPVDNVTVALNLARMTAAINNNIRGGFVLARLEIHPPAPDPLVALDSILIHIPILPDLPRLVLQAAVDGGDAAGVDRVMLPAAYVAYRHFYYGIWENGEDRIFEGEMHTELMSVQTAERVIQLAGAPNQSQASRLVSATWNPRTRLFTVRGADRIIFADLE